MQPSPMRTPFLRKAARWFFIASAAAWAGVSGGAGAGAGTSRWRLGPMRACSIFRIRSLRRIEKVWREDGFCLEGGGGHFAVEAEGVAEGEGLDLRGRE